MDKKSRNLKLERILWVDLEMTGLSPEKDLIMEIAAIVTDWKFAEIDTYHGVIKNSEMAIKKRFKANKSFWDANIESRDGLIGQNADGKSLKLVQQELIDFIEKNFKPGVPVLLGGNSIHMDRRFIINYLPKFDSKLHYRMLDVSAWKVVFESKYKMKFAKPDAHRALDDIRGSIAELQYYTAKIK